jgi:hypothetical protein
MADHAYLNVDEMLSILYTMDVSIHDGMFSVLDASRPSISTPQHLQNM